ncbi:DUF6963 family protein [Leptolyngbya iicbica]|uniref:Uncharacterized protein n=2 Tax=Cyanophyceae TaxID=3028117 RepID=A0A4Q7E898_9CYAN|nr:hypothetical protein [Leptolyngbya sp. LK]RZM79027.1 hypothetical protein DYY88_09660 [Leptolyngbya sp. LK]
MTIAIAASGPNAGLAIFKALQAAEAVGTGAIRGFVMLAVITSEGELQRYETQRGGTRTLFTEGETTGVEPPEMVQGAIAAALISSGPDRPTPLSQFLTADANAGLVTAHRVPQGPSINGIPLNVEVLDALQSGQSAQAATESVLAANPQADVGFITIDRQGNLYLQNAPRVQKRPDIGMAYREDAATGAKLGVLHNAISPYSSLAPLVADIGFRCMVEPAPVIGHFTIAAGVPIIYGDVDAVDVDEYGVAQRVVTSDRTFTDRDRSGVGIYLHSIVRHNGQAIGKTLFEPICIVSGGHIVEMSGQTSLQISYTHP